MSTIPNIVQILNAFFVLLMLNFQSSSDVFLLETKKQTQLYQPDQSIFSSIRYTRLLPKYTQEVRKPILLKSTQA